MKEKELDGLKKGLTEKEAKKQYEKYGENEIEDTSKKSPIKILLRQIKSNFIIYLLFVAMILSFIVDKTLTGYVILGVILIVIITGFIQEYRAEKAIEALKGMIAPISTVIRNGKEKEIHSKEIVPGDVLVLRNGEKIPADCIVLEEKNLLLDEAVLTGESKEVKKKPVKNTKNYEDENQVFMGSFVVGGKCIAKVVHTGMNTKFGGIAGMISTSEKELPLQKKINYIVRYMAILGSIFAILTGTIMLIREPGFDKKLIVESLMIIIAVAVSSFPEGFPVVLITSLASGSYRMAKRNAIVNRMSIIETLGETTTICSDKTGTITKGEMTVRRIFTDHKEFSVTGRGYEGKGEFFRDKDKVNLENNKTLSLLLKTSILCNDAKIEKKKKDDTYDIRGMPTEAALSILGIKANMPKEDIDFEREDEIPFTSERKLMSVLVKENNEEKIYTKGSLEILLDKCKYIQREKGVFKLHKKDKEKILKENKKFMEESLRTLGLAYKKADSKNLEGFEKNLVFLGFVGIEDPPRKEIGKALKVCKKAGINVKMITGDNKETASSIANEIGLDKGEILEGRDLEKMTDEELKKIVDNITIFARVKPEHKLKIVKALKKRGEIVTMTGDGVNDAPALKEAHIGVAMGKNGTDVSRSVSDLTLKDDNFATIVHAIKEGRTIFTNIQKFSNYQISVNFSQVALIFLAILIGLPLPLVAIQILFINLFSDELIAITLAFNPYSKDTMIQKPRKKSGIITKPLFLMLAISGTIMSLGSLITFYYGLHIGLPEIEARSLAFMTMVFFGVTNAFNFRSFRKITLKRTPFSNKALVYMSLFSVASALIIIYTPLSIFLESASIKPALLIIPLIVSFSVIIALDIIKYINIKRDIWSEDMQNFKRKKR